MNKSIFDPVRQGFLLNLWRNTAGLPDIDFLAPAKLQNTFAELNENRDRLFSSKFIEYMRNRLIMGGMRYGVVNQQGKPQYDRLTAIKRRLSIYEKTGNTEPLVDVANLCMFEFCESTHPNKHFRATDNDGHVDVIEKN